MGRTGKLRRGRRDATRVDLGRSFPAIFPYLMRGRNESVAYYPVVVDAENLLTRIEEMAGTENEMTLFEAVLLALIRILRERPDLNRYIIGRRLYQRHNVELSFVARRALTLDSSETVSYTHLPAGTG